jgi:hypothetical protein
MEDASKITEAFNAWTTDLLPHITTLANQGLDDDVLDVAVSSYHDVLHLFFIPNITDIIENYMEEPQESPIPQQVPLTLRNPGATSFKALTSDNPIDVAFDRDHPGDGWQKYDASNTRMYPLVFVNEQGLAEAATYISLQAKGDETRLLGTRKKNATVYSMPLHARPFPSPNFTRPGPKDTDHSIFHPSHTALERVDDAVVDLGDPGVIADVHRYRSYVNQLEGFKRRRTEIENDKRRIEGKLLDVESRLTHAAIRTRLLPYLYKARSTTPPAMPIPSIRAAQGPPDDNEDMDTDVTVTRGPVLGKRRRGKPPFPYCLKCNEEEPDHCRDECPLWKTCRWCFSTQHTHNDCEDPHHQCTTRRCIVPTWHPHFRRCTKLPYSSIQYTLDCVVSEYETQCAAFDYDDDLYKWE